MTILSPRAGTYGPSDFPLPFSVALNDFGSVDYSLDGAAPEAMTGDNGASSTTFTALQGSLGSGNHGFEAFATDTQGNTTSDSIAFAVDLDTPAVAFADPTPADGSSQSAAAVDIRLATNSGLDHYSFVEMDEDLYLWLRMDDVIGGTVTDLSAHGNHGTIQGDAVENPDGKFGVAFEFDGIDHGGTIISDRILINGFQDRHNIFDTSFTVMAWAKPDVSDKMVIIGNKSITALPGWHLRTSGGNHKLRIGVNSGDTSATAASAQASDPMVPGAWVHVVGIYDHTVPHIQLYLDGVLVATKANNVSPLGYGNDLELAVGMPEDPRKTWDGLIDEVLIFNRVLSASEIKALYSSSADQYQNTYSGLGAGVVHGYTGYSVNSLGILDQTETRSLAIE